MDTGCFSCDSTTPTGNRPYYDLRKEPAVKRYEPFEPEGLAASSSYTYYKLVAGDIGEPGDVHTAPTPSVVADPALDLVTSKAVGVGPYGDATAVASGAAGYGVSAVQYGRLASYFRDDFLTGAMGEPVTNPANPPTLSTIPLIFDVSMIRGNPAPEYYLWYGPEEDFSQSTWTKLPATQIGTSTEYTATAISLLANTTYYFFSQAENSSGIINSETVQKSTIATGGTPPTGILETPYFSLNSILSITLNFNNTGLTSLGNPASRYYVYYGTSPNDLPNFVIATFVSGNPNLLQAIIPAVQGASYWAQAIAFNGIGEIDSGVGGPFQPAVDFSPHPPPIAPVVNPAQPPSASIISMIFDSALVLGTRPITYDLQVSRFPGMAPSVTSVMTGTQGGIFTGAATGLLAGTGYYFRVTANNGVGSTVAGAVSARIFTNP
jgi:hypothetical protein